MLLHNDIIVTWQLNISFETDLVASLLTFKPVTPQPPALLMHRFVELKKSLPVSFTRELRGYLTTIYQSATPDAFDTDLNDLDKLRQECTNPIVSTTSINTILLRYYLQLIDMENRVNLDAADLKVPFAWYNCHAGDDKKIIVSSSNIHFEEACILFNVAASHVQLAGMESYTSTEGLKKACNYYMVIYI